MALNDDIVKRIQSDFPAFASLLDIPEIAVTLVAAENEGWDIGQLQAHIFATKWWRGQSESQRNAAILQRTDPTGYNRQANVIRQNIQYEAGRLGARLTEAETLMLSRLAMNGGWSPDEITRQIIATGRRRSFGAGQIKSTGDDIMALSKAYGIGVGQGWVDVNASRIASGEKTMDWMKDYFHQTALHRYGDNAAVKQGLNAGHTLADIMEPTLSLVAKELELGAGAQWDLNEGMAQKIINYHDVDTGQIRPMTDSEAVQFARSDRRWRDTNGAKSLVTDASNAIAKFMGAKV